MELTVWTESLLVEINVGDKTTIVTIDAIGNLHLVDSTDFIEHDLRILNLILIQKLFGLGAIGAETGTENGSLFGINDLGQTYGIWRLAHCTE